MAESMFQFNVNICQCEKRTMSVSLDDMDRTRWTLAGKETCCGQSWDTPLADQYVDSDTLRMLAAIFIAEASRVEREEDRKDRLREAALSGLARFWDEKTDKAIGGAAIDLAESIGEAEFHRSWEETKRAKRWAEEHAAKLAASKATPQAPPTTPRKLGSDS